MMQQTTLIQVKVDEREQLEPINNNKFFTYMPTIPEYADIFDKLISLDQVFAEGFPELENMDIKVKITGEQWCGACYDHTRNIIRFSGPNNMKSSLETLGQIMFHELTHARQFLIHDIPHGERSADVYCITRLPIWIMREAKRFGYISIPNKLKSTHPEEIKILAKKAIVKRSQGLRNYLVWFESEVKKLDNDHLKGDQEEKEAK